MLDFKRMLENKKIRIVSFFLVFALLICVFSAGINTLSIHHDDLMQSRNKSMVMVQKQEKNSLDVIFVGDSLAYSAFSPMKMWEDHGIAAYVCAQSGQKIQETYSMLEVVFKNQKPKVVIIETSPMFRVRGMKEEIRSSISETCKQLFPIFRYHNIWKPLLMGKSYGEQSFNGYLLRWNKVAYANSANYMNEAKSPEDIAPSIDIYLQKIQNLCEKNGAQVLLVSVPSPYNYNNARCQAIAAYAKTQGVTYLNLNGENSPAGIDWNTDVLDNGDHLNVSGADRISSYMGDYLTQTYDLPDHRGEDAYASYSKMAKIYDDIAKEKIREIRQ